VTVAARERIFQVMKIRVVAHTPEAEKIMGYCARASSPKNQKRMEKGELSASGLLKYCAKEGHWSVFEMANVVVEIQTTRAISAQILRHRSFSFQEFSQRYAKIEESIPAPEMRLSGAKNRQSSLAVTHKFDEEVQECIDGVYEFYLHLIDSGVATETARMVLPMCTPTKLYMNGTVRSWIHFLDVRCKDDVQKEHRLVADAVRSELGKILPTCKEAFGW
jgi:thymidylate synthase (FAD)